MNKYQEAFDRFCKHTEALQKLIFEENNFNKNDYLKNKVTIQELVDKETPTKPLPNKILEEGSYISWACPNCKNYVSSGFYYTPLEAMENNHNRCKECGQRLNWGEE